MGARLTDTGGKIVAGVPGTGFNVADYQSSTINDFNKSNFLIYGPKKTGKTLLAATISDYFPEFDRVPVPAPAYVELKDVVWLAFDKSPTDTLLQFKLGVPRILDLRRLLRKLGRDEFFFRLPAVLKSYSDDDSRFIIVDTVSEFDKLLRNWWSKNVPLSKTGQENTMQMWTKFGDDHLEFRYTLAEAYPGSRIIYLCHAKGVFEQQQESMRINMERTAAANDRGDITFDVTGQNGNGYASEGSTILVTRKIPGVGNEKARYEVLTDSDGGWEGGTRFSTLLPKVCEPNLKRILGRITAVMPKENAE